MFMQLLCSRQFSANVKHFVFSIEHGTRKESKIGIAQPLFPSSGQVRATVQNSTLPVETA
ncbi:hypothetical protein AND_006044 [Anopheles darlingi]|uniref:Uncharacterized protein n=1 Tax=Anopheles darlingi TaxID=43151 RepID=W5JDW0_ANODA|nr:hypothetical protein AND_006044 [Anopheles darlingi]